MAIGYKYLNNFKKYSYKHFYNYCRKNDIGIIIITQNLINKSSSDWKKPRMAKIDCTPFNQKKYKDVKNICMIDTDILINENSPNIFQFHKNLLV